MASADLIVTRPVQTARGVDAPVILQRGRTVPGHHTGHDGPITFRVASVGCGQRGQSLIGAVLRRHAGKVSHSSDPGQLNAGDGASAEPGRGQRRRQDRAANRPHLTAQRYAILTSVGPHLITPAPCGGLSRNAPAGSTCSRDGLAARAAVGRARESTGSPFLGPLELVEAEQAKLARDHPGERVQRVGDPVLVGHDRNSLKRRMMLDQGTKAQL